MRGQTSPVKLMRDLRSYCAFFGHSGHQLMFLTLSGRFLHTSDLACIPAVKRDSMAHRREALRSGWQKSAKHTLVLSITS